ncbi:MAG: TIM barrel protein [Planctomycetaceae bacterium]
MNSAISRRQALASLAAAGLGTQLLHPSRFVQAADQADFQFRYIVSSCMYGYLYIGEILPEIEKCGASHLDLWPKRHGNQREQLDDLGEDRFRDMLQKHHVSLGCITQYKLGPFALKEEMQLAQRFGCSTIVTGAVGPKNLTGKELKSAVGTFVEQMKPHLEVAQETGVTIAIENHANNLIDSPDSLRYLAELRPSRHLAIALAPAHLPQNPELIADLISDLGDSLEMFYAWETGDGFMERLPKERELKQMPGRGPLDYGPLVRALMDIQYTGWTQIFMHPVPRGIPILETAAEVTAEIQRSREYLASQLTAAKAGR